VDKRISRRKFGAALAATAAAGAIATSKVNNSEMKKQNWGKGPNGEEVDLYTLRNSKGIEASITTYGGRLVTLKTPDRDGKFADIVLGFDDLPQYLANNPFFGALAGRYANRIANGEFQLDGHTYHLAKNNGPNTLHGGLVGFDKKVWQAEDVSASNGHSLRLKYVSKDGEENFPGTLTTTVTYTLSDNDDLTIDYKATTDKKTVLNLTNHSYFDLAGAGAGEIIDHVVTINADKFTPVNANLIPTGDLKTVDGTPFDFRTATRVGARINDKDQQLQYGQGYDHNFVVNRSGNGPSLAARVVDPKSGRAMEVLTTQPGVQFYTGNHLSNGIKGKGGATYGYRYGLCFETQHFPNSPNQPNFPSTELAPGQQFHEITVFKFSVA
jgi:aldose 1-epimerase